MTFMWAAREPACRQQRRVRPGMSGPFHVCRSRPGMALCFQPYLHFISPSAPMERVSRQL